MGGFGMATESGWYLDTGRPSWSVETQRFSFFLQKRDRERVLCMVTANALAKAGPPNDLSEPAMRRVFDAHRQLIELRAAEKLNAGAREVDGSVLLGTEDI
jgi:hypothetical protein